MKKKAIKNEIIQNYASLEANVAFKHIFVNCLLFIRLNFNSFKKKKIFLIYFKFLSLF